MPLPNASSVSMTEVCAALQPYGLSAGIGLHCGDVVEILVGTETTRQYTIFDDAVNLTARLQNQAERGQIVISQQAWERLRQKPSALKPQVHYAPLKGKREALPVYILA